MYEVGGKSFEEVKPVQKSKTASALWIPGDDDDEALGGL